MSELMATVHENDGIKLPLAKLQKQRKLSFPHLGKGWRGDEFGVLGRKPCSFGRVDRLNRSSCVLDPSSASMNLFVCYTNKKKVQSSSSPTNTIIETHNESESVHGHLRAVGIASARAAEVDARLLPRTLCVVLSAVAPGSGGQDAAGIGVPGPWGAVLDSGQPDGGGVGEVPIGVAAGAHAGARVGFLMNRGTVDVAATEGCRRRIVQGVEEGRRPVSDGAVVAVHQPPFPALLLLEMYLRKMRWTHMNECCWKHVLLSARSIRS
ncbi:hypothetical protein MUK42_12761 [Musa troglodytarum]|uniref:Uncharacterized protein n=1 Tax=Musa troglodytarum TaxID=320322 RepID=A0A9E7HFY3_9LILI|nr:hypothetical protein MUK42_12761 [Musa troglodytarum]